MPRKSPSERAGALWRAKAAKATPTTPPSWLGPEAAELFRAIVADRPADHFRPGSVGLLAAFCDLSTRLADTDGTLAERLELAGKVALLAQRLRLTPQTTIHRRAGALDEAGVVSPLLGGHSK